MYVFFLTCLFIHVSHNAVSSTRMAATFPTGSNTNGSNPMMLTRSLPDLEEITLCQRLRPLADLTSKGRVTLSYGSANMPNEFVLRFVPITLDNGEEDVYFEVSVRNQVIRSRNAFNTYMKYDFKSRRWFEFCISWSSFTGEVLLHDLNMNNRVEMGRDVQTGQTIRGGGNLVVGQYPSPSTGKMDPDEGWVGAITDLQIWDQKMEGYFFKCSSQLTGNVVAWLKTPFQVFGGVVFNEVNLC